HHVRAHGSVAGGRADGGEQLVAERPVPGVQAVGAVKLYGQYALAAVHGDAHGGRSYVYGTARGVLDTNAIPPPHRPVHGARARALDRVGPGRVPAVALLRGRAAGRRRGGRDAAARPVAGRAPRG